MWPRKILMSKNLDIKILRTKSLGGADAVSAHPQRLGYDGAIKIQGQGWMSHGSCGNRRGYWHLDWPPIRIGHSNFSAYNSPMEISLTPELEEKLARIASEAGKGANQVVQELVKDYLDHDEWFRREVQRGLTSLDDGKFVSHEEVGRQLERILRPS
jgi:predicted transcriptional regulator